jgi:hypothetical protein
MAPAAEQPVMIGGQKHAVRRLDDRRVDEASDQSFPASDPPAYTLCAVGAPERVARSDPKAGSAPKSSRFRPEKT